jgi:predicted dehydrogenase
MNSRETIDIAFIGCGYVADYYVATLANYPWLRIAGIFDIDQQRLEAFSTYYGLKQYESMVQLLGDHSVKIVVNLTNPRSHYEVSLQCLEAGKHVYSEKPLAMDYDRACELVEMAEKRSLEISTAPCSLLGNLAQTLWKSIRDEVVGDVHLVYAELDDGMVHQMPFKKWISESGAPWPYRDEFEVGCTVEHAGYYLSWLVAMFGPVETVTAFSTCIIKTKLADEILDPPNTADFSLGLLKFKNGVIARLTTSIVAPHNHNLKVIGDKGLIEIDDCWHNDAKVYVRKQLRIRRKLFMSPFRQTVKIPSKPLIKVPKTGGNRMDYALGIAELANAMQGNRTPKLSARFSLHITEVTLALQQAGIKADTYQVKSTFKPIEPMDWAQ